MSSAKFNLVESAYTLDERYTWLGNLVDPLRRSLGGLKGCFAVELLKRDDRPIPGWVWADDERTREAVEMWFSAASTPLLRSALYRPLAVYTIPEIVAAIDISMSETPLPDVLARAGARDAFAIAALGPRRTGMVFGAMVEGPVEIAPHERQSWVHVAVHIAASTRLRDRLDGNSASSHADAVLRPDGKLEHAESCVDDQFAELLSRAVAGVERARKRERSDEALALWQGLVAGRWSLVEHYEGPNRRYYVATRNEPRVASKRGLSKRQAQVVGYIGAGVSIKDIAYALGIDPVTVRSYARMAMKKLGIASKAELITVYNTLMGGQ
jgi:DNA-binding CsgD family transcriptional regulator